MSLAAHGINAGTLVGLGSHFAIGLLSSPHYQCLPNSYTTSQAYFLKSTGLEVCCRSEFQGNKAADLHGRAR